MSYYSQAFESRRLYPKVSHRKFNGPVNFEYLPGCFQLHPKYLFSFVNEAFIVPDTNDQPYIKLLFSQLLRFKPYKHHPVFRGIVIGMV